MLIWDRHLLVKLMPCLELLCAAAVRSSPYRPKGLRRRRRVRYVFGNFVELLSLCTIRNTDPIRVPTTTWNKRLMTCPSIRITQQRSKFCYYIMTQLVNTIQEWIHDDAMLKTELPELYENGNYNYNMHYRQRINSLMKHTFRFCNEFNFAVGVEMRPV